ncbi:hypothetical protein HOP50_11g63460 [Chloropicon primus]|uniref:Uncharacterized protein n=1 Tax=Chloropicon primus TaxID=1764295 RepID=A0A5B8MU13_9CHLO|nr:hypothetical protein A3770_11p63240 [Chloropicon primus]UPR03019.1 hypothetical protein HOP50_11g63460 [Chloropicon primus]|eukprot:QDZ23806.1 hypothetical protein A3770_11p63240 [Chloropicon primus]
MAKEFGSRADMLSSKIDEVSRNRIWEEHCTKEVAKLQMNTHFAINDPTKMDCLPEKPNYVYPKIKLSDGDVELATTKLSAVCSKKDVHLDPSEKHPLPMTTSQEYGWIHTALVKPNEMFAHKLNSCDITKYANAYYSMSGTTPFSRKEGSPSGK